jgi:hypothetical protein
LRARHVGGGASAAQKVRAKKSPFTSNGLLSH